jgi:cysteine desulfurase
MIYLDYAAATPLDPGVLTAMLPYYGERFYNPSALYLPAQAVAKDLLAARSRVAHWLGARPSEVIFTAGATEANNLAIHGVLQQWPEANLVVSAIEHDSVLEVAKQYQHQVAAVTPQGIIDLTVLEAAIDDKTVLVSVMYANNEIGTVQPLRKIAALLEQIKQARRQVGNKLPLYLHSDAAQAANYLDLHAARLGVDLLSINGGKIYGPKQSGALYVKAGVVLQPWLRGGGQERGLRSGTENVPACIGLAAALDLVQTERHIEAKRLQALQDKTFHDISRQLPSVVVNGSRKNRLPNNLHITVPGADNERLLVLLEQQGILAAAGSACSASNEEPSHVLRAIGLSPADAQASLRFTMGRTTTEADMTKLVSTLKEVCTP